MARSSELLARKCALYVAGPASDVLPSARGGSMAGCKTPDDYKAGAMGPQAGERVPCDDHEHALRRLESTMGGTQAAETTENR